MDLLERAAALDELDAGLTGLSSRGGVVLLAGEAGIGKSALVKRFRRRRSAQADFLMGSCDPLLTPRALGPVYDIGREAGGRLSESLASGRRETIFAALLGHLALAARRQVVVVEDAHWADEATLDLLVFLGRRIEHTPALLLVTYRDDELGADHPLLTVIGRLPADAVRRIRLEPLSEAAVAEMARRVGRPDAGLRALTGGNPLLLTEVLAAADSEVPHTVRDLVLARLAGLPRPAREAVQLVSVVPNRVEPWLLETAARPATAGVEAGVASGLLVMDAERIGFRHELLRRAVEGSLSVLERRRLNRQVLAALADSGEPVDAARLAHHAREAGDVDAVLRYAPEAARQAAAVAAHREAVSQYRAALAHADRLPVPARADLLEGYSVEAYLSGLADVAVAARQSAVTLREAAGDRERVGEGLRWLSRLHWWAGNRRDAESAAARAIAVLEALPAGRQLALAYSNQSQLDMLASRSELAMHWAGQALTLARELNDVEASTHALTNIGSARLQRDDPGGRVELEEAFQLAVAAGLEDHAARAIGNLATIGAEVRHLDRARQDLDRALAFVQQHELAGWVQHVLGHRARFRLDLGDWAGAEQDARAALTERVSGGGRFVDALVPLGLVQARRGDPAAAATLQEATERAFATSELQWIAPVAAARAEHAWLSGDDGRAVEEVAAVYPMAEQARHPWFGGELALWSRMAGGPPLTPALMAAPHRLLLAGDWRGAAEAWHGLGWPYHRALALMSGDDDDARMQALALLDGLGARQTALRLRRELRRRGTLRIPAGPTRATAANPAGLSNRQVEVLRLLVEGLTDAEIAARLCISPKTVGHHVSALLSKLGAGTRHQAAAVARGLGVTPAGTGEAKPGN
ncbi:AAA family ATPase [Dactylosporangium sucinum]|uniref:ATP-binding protein n=1 Tax=Dactylosporangium sucinum TaxID=1424081 RepID=UPI00167D5B4D|nr:AAA family ATPase [Dactylosporangium sucinum]